MEKFQLLEAKRGTDKQIAETKKKTCITAKKPRHIKNTQTGANADRKIMNNTMRPRFDRFVWAHWDNMHAVNFWLRGREIFRTGPLNHESSSSQAFLSRFLPYVDPRDPSQNRNANAGIRRYKFRPIITQISSFGPNYLYLSGMTSK